MTLMIVGLALFLSAHSVRMFADSWRTSVIARLGEGPWKGLYSVVSAGGFALMIWGYSRAGGDGGILYVPAAGSRHLNVGFTLVAFVLIAAAYVPRNHIKVALGHPMLGGVAAWALGHLLAVGSVRDVVLFGAMLIWAVADFAACRRRDRRLGLSYPAGVLSADLITLAVGIVGWTAFAVWLHIRLIGVDPFA